jgi:hypothetical protein
MPSLPRNSPVGPKGAYVESVGEGFGRGMGYSDSCQMSVRERA